MRYLERHPQPGTLDWHAATAMTEFLSTCVLAQTPAERDLLRRLQVLMGERIGDERRQRAAATRGPHDERPNL